MDALPLLVGTSRLPTLVRSDRSASLVELAILFALGVLAAALALFVRLKLGMPGHNILFTAAPIAVGIAVVPRRYAASVVSGAGIVSALALGAGLGLNLGVAKLTALVAMGPLLDLAIARTHAQPGWRLVVALVSASVVANACAFVARMITEPFGGLIIPVVSYLAWGAAAGLVCALALFRASKRAEPRA